MNARRVVITMILVMEFVINNAIIRAAHTMGEIAKLHVLLTVVNVI